VAAQHVLDLVADLADRVERGARVLEDHRDLAPADVAHVALRRRRRSTPSIDSRARR
jgi:predicted DNA-binding protein (UPF0278 family)